MSEPLPELLDNARLRAELGVSRAAADAILRNVPTVHVDGLRKVFARRDDVHAYLRACERNTDRRVA